MRTWLKNADFEEPNPEQTPGKPWDRLKEIAVQLGARGPGNKIAFAKKMIKNYSFDISNAAHHPACASASTLIDYFAADDNEN